MYACLPLLPGLPSLRPQPKAPEPTIAIVAEQVDLIKKNLRYISKAAHRENDRKIENRRLEVVEHNKVALAKLRHLAPFKGNDEFRLAAIKAFQTTLEVYSADYKKVNALASTRSESFENMQRFFDAQENGNKKLAVVDDSVDAAQQRFAKAYGFTYGATRESARLSAHVKAVNEVNHYQHEVFLPFFRLQISTARLTDALNAQFAAAFEAARVATEAEKTVVGLVALPGFRGKDVSCRNAARDFANMYVLLCAIQFMQVAELMKNKDYLTKTDAQSINVHFSTLNQQQ